MTKKKKAKKAAKAKAPTKVVDRAEEARQAVDKAELAPTIEEMMAALAEHDSVALAAEAMGMTASNFQAKWMRRARPPSPKTPGAYLASIGRGRSQGPSPTVNFRLPEYALLEEAAAEAGLSPSDHARELVRAALGRWVQKRVKKREKSAV